MERFTPATPSRLYRGLTAPPLCPRKTFAFTPGIRFRCLSTTPAARSDHHASNKLFADAAREEAEGSARNTKSPRLQLLENTHANWDGDEAPQDAVLRMLVDKHKPLRSGTVRSADARLRAAPPRVAVDGALLAARAGWEAMADAPLIPAVEGHRPWHTTFVAPAHAEASVKLGIFPPRQAAARRVRKGADDGVDETTQKTERELARRRETAGRLGRAKENTMNYRLGIRGEGGAGGGGEGRGANPLSLRGWQSLIEDKIEKARIAGHFKKIKGRGKPIKREIAEHNPFIAREEFIMNRIVQRNGAAPPWVDVQQEMDEAINTFREGLKQSWARYAIRMLTLSHHPSVSPTPSHESIAAFRDAAWEARERAYHDESIAQLNALVRKYNGVAPYVVRRAYYSREAELARAYEGAVQDIHAGIEERSRAAAGALERGVGMSGEVALAPFKIWPAVRQALARLVPWSSRLRHGDGEAMGR
ncbi:hypothetical protein CONPUDRAFT_84848 [Coniophora puteana RWD-64-598 SS2]|uniref:DnaJ homologue subfamily C member 28 conserved domain-containing protein n=1 Tax=Coniophora puteana (strain RWD-64-598) TaxID=741705 RepID=A0A5M3MC13_CONPW|nr:uncharacterized protein CONPUDRAFT_84848 [Coniophora puteana RWD-64-598 SS2]EIW76181.1 hypothetical protein CONPUDRAFT_84848 [Coniophora puteana RWD-64-598 SS2]